MMLEIMQGQVQSMWIPLKRNITGLVDRKIQERELKRQQEHSAYIDEYAGETSTGQEKPQQRQTIILQI